HGEKFPMRLVCRGRKSAGRGFVLLAPERSSAMPFHEFIDDPARRQRLLARAQRLRGEIYVRDGAIRPWELSADGRHIQPADHLSWHLLTLDEHEEVMACIRYFAHRPDVSFSDLAISQSAVARSRKLGPTVREAIQGELAYARQRGFYYVELGGWAISEEMRCSAEALRMLLTVFALAQSMGGALGVSNATTRHHSSSILRRVGGRPLAARGVSLPSYVDSHNNGEMNLLTSVPPPPNAHYRRWISECRSASPELRVIPSDVPATNARGLACVIRPSLCLPDFGEFQ